MFTQREKKHLLISILVLGFAFGFNDNQPTFNISNWIFNFIRALFSAAIILLLYELTHKFVAHRYGADTEYEIWTIRRYGFWRSAKFPKKIFNRTINSFPLGIILSILTTLISNGLFYIIPLSSFKLIEKPHLRIGAKFRQITDFEEAKVSASSILLLAITALILTSLDKPVIFGQLSTMLFIFIAYSLIPFSTLDGARIFFGSIPLYITIILFIVISYFIIGQLGIFLAFLLALIGAALIVFLYIHELR